MRVSEFRDLSKDELVAKLSKLKEEHLTMRCLHSTGQLADTSSITKLRADIARGKTILAQKNTAGDN